MSDQQVDQGRRTWVAISCGMGAVGGVAVAVPFVSTFQPSERARAAGAAVEADIGGLKPGEKLTVEWRGKPVWVVRRTPEQLAALAKLDPQLADPSSLRKPDELTPEYARNGWRSRKPEILVVVGICTHLGCSPSDKFQPGAQASCVLATARRSTWRGAYSRTSRHPTTSRCHRTCSCPTPAC
jgi:ubiquinol-cytochrome c reductase iron-sulfur subunit